MKSRVLILLVCFGVVLLLAVGAGHFDFEAHLMQVLKWIQAQGVVGIGYFGLFYSFVTGIFLPEDIMALSGGVIYGAGFGGLLVALCATLSSTISFLIGRYLARDWITRKIEGRHQLMAIERAISDEGWRMVALIRLSPLFPFALLNYAFGLTRIPLREFILASFFGKLPVSLVYGYLGSLAAGLAGLGGGAAPAARTPLDWVLFVVSLLVTIAVAFYVTKVVRRKILNCMPEPTS